MAVYKSEKYVWNSTTNEWDLYYDRTSADNIVETPLAKVLTSAERDKISNYLADFNIANKLLKLNENGDLSIGGSITTSSSFNGDIFTDYISSDSDFINIGAGISKVEINAQEVIINGTENGVALQGGITVGGAADFNGVSNFNDIFINGTIGSDGDALTFGVSTMNFNDASLKSIGDPVDSQDAANKRWVEQLVSQGTHVVGAARAATTGNVASLSGTVTIDGVALVAGDRVLVKEQTTASQNGVYIVNSGAWTKLTNDSDKGSLVTVLEGTTQKRNQYYNQNGTAWVLYWVDDDYYATVNGGLELDGTGLGFGIKDGGITNDMIDDYIINPIKIQAFESFEIGSVWGDLSDASNGSELESHFGNLYAAIKMLRGTAKYNTNNTNTISDAYSKIELKNSVRYGTAVPTGNPGGADGDIYLKRLA